MCNFSFNIKCFIQKKKNLAMNAIMLQNPIIQFSLYYLSRGRLWEVKNKRKFQTLALKVVVVNCKRWSLKRSFRYIDFPFSILDNLSLRRSG